MTRQIKMTPDGQPRMICNGCSTAVWFDPHSAEAPPGWRCIELGGLQLDFCSNCTDRLKDGPVPEVPAPKVSVTKLRGPDNDSPQLVTWMLAFQMGAEAIVRNLESMRAHVEEGIRRGYNFTDEHGAVFGTAADVVDAIKRPAPVNIEVPLEPS